MVSLLPLVPLLPLFGALSMLFARRAPKSLVSLLCPGTVLASFLLSCGAVIQLTRSAEKTRELVYFPWMPHFGADWGILLDPLSAVMMLVVTGIGFLIHVYSTGYMPHDASYRRFFGYLNLFVFFMLLLVLANNYLLLFIGWEGVGLASYLLIGFDFGRKAAADAGKKAFLVNRIGDAAFLLGILTLFITVGSLRFTEVNRALATPQAAAGLAVAAALLFAGACGKSAQFPLHVWLPDAMEGPTPVSALIHAATMVTAGVYLMARSWKLLAAAPAVADAIAIGGAFTAIFAASIALAQTDIKRVLAYSTVSQLGYMFLAVGVGAYWVAVFHLVTHAFFKALLFLGAGSVTHALGGEQDLRRMGGLRRKLPVTFWTMTAGALALAGVPGLAGFFSKDEILWEAYRADASRILFTTGMVTAFLTAVYMWRLMTLAFGGSPRHAHEPHDAPPAMAVPLIVLALGSVAAGYIGVPKLWTAFGDPFRSLEHWLSYVFSAPGGPAASAHRQDTATEWTILLASAAVAFGGILLARARYQGGRLPQETTGPLQRFLLHAWHVDDFYNIVIVNRIFKGGASRLAAFDRLGIDGAVNGTAFLTRATGSISIWFDRWVVDGLVNLSAFSARVLSFPVRLLQTGSVQAYALLFVAGLLLFAGYYATTAYSAVKP